MNTDKQIQSKDTYTQDNAELAAIPMLNGLQVLLVEDEPDMAYLFTFVLEEMGADVTRVFSVAEALAQLEQHQPDLLICDIRLPDANGFYLLRRLRSLGMSQEELPAIAVSSYCREVSHQTALDAGFQWYLPKPIDPNELATEILRITHRQI